MDELIAYREGLLLALERVIPELSKIMIHTPLKDWHRKSVSDTHTPFYYLVHLWVLEASVFALNVRRINDEDMPLLTIFNDEAWMKSHPRPKERPRNFLQDIAALRSQELDWLRLLPPTSWSRTARHPWWGVHTLQWWVELQLEYSHQHLSLLSGLRKM